MSSAQQADAKQHHHHHRSKQAEVLSLKGAEGETLLDASLYSRLRDPSTSSRFQTPALLALSSTLGAACAEHNAAFLSCKAHHKNPEKCLDDGVLVTRCADNVWQLVRERCFRSFQQYAQCLNQENLQFHACRPHRLAFQSCISEADPALGAAVKSLEEHNSKTRPPAH